MLNSEVKYILQEQFSKERNYKIIMNNVEKRHVSYDKILKFILLPACAIIIIAIILPNINKNEDDYKEIAYTNTIYDNKQNTVFEIGNSNKIVEKTIEGEEASWAYDPTNPINLINDISETKCVVKVKIASIGEGEMLPKQENFYNPFTCYTPIEMQVVSNLLDENELLGNVTAYITGGKMKIANILKGTKEEIEYMGIYDVSQVDPEKYIEYKWSVPYYEPNIGEEYVIILNKVNPNLYQIMGGGYGIFKIEKTKEDMEIYRNVITNKEWKM